MKSDRGLVEKLIKPAIVAGVLGLSGGVLATVLYHNQIRDEGERAANTTAEQAQVYEGCRYVAPIASLMTCVAEGTKAAYDQKHTNADLHAQQEVAAWTFGMFVFGVLSFVTSGLALAALVWTFREQRKLTVNQSRAYLELIAAHYTAARFADIVEGEDKEDQIDISLTLYNSGETPASDVRVVLQLDCTPESSGFGEEGEQPYTITDISGLLPRSRPRAPTFSAPRGEACSRTPK